MEERKQARGRRKTHVLLVLGGLGLVGALTALKLPFGLVPGGLGFAGAWGLAGLPGGILLFIVALGLRLSLTVGVLFPAGLGSLPLLLAFYGKGRGYAWVRPFLYLLLSGGVFLLLFWRGGQAVALREAGEAAVVGLLAWLLAPGLRKVGGRLGLEGPARTGTDRSGLAFYFLFLLLYLTLGQISLWPNNWWQLELNYCLLFFLLLVASFGPWVNFAPAMGQIFILAELTLGQAQPWLIFWIGGSSFVPAHFRLKGKGRAVAALVLPGVVGALLWWGRNGLWSALVEATLALLLFLAIPSQTLLRWGDFLTGNDNGGEGRNFSANRLLWAETISRLRELGLLFQELAQTFAPTSSGKKGAHKEELLALFQEVADANCLTCEKYELCWKERFYQTYQELFTLIGWAELGVKVEVSHLKGHLAQECVKQEALLTTVNLRMEQERTSHYWHRRFSEAKLFLAHRLTGIAGVLAQMAETSAVRADDPLVKEKRLGQTLRKAGVSGAEVSVLVGQQEGQTRLLVKKKACVGAQECRLVVAPMLSAALDQQLAVTHWECGRHREAECTFFLGPEPVYEVESAVVQQAKQGNQVSGDSQRLRRLGDNLVLCLLSDGMGVGTAAARISQRAVGLMEEMLAAGFKKRFALESLNTLLLLATPEEDFATLDLLLFDRLSGEVELFKVGSAPTYIKKGREVQVIRSTSLPIGIVPKVEPEYYRDFLDDGDLVVMVSDGAATLGTLGEDWILKALKKWGESTAERLSQYLFELAKIEAGGEINDDLTIMVLQIKAAQGVWVNKI